jgi:hypothetical protein
VIKIWGESGSWPASAWVERCRIRSDASIHYAGRKRAAHVEVPAD